MALTRETAQFGAYGSGRHGMTRRLELGFELGSGRSRVRGHIEVGLVGRGGNQVEIWFCVLFCILSRLSTEEGERHGRMGSKEV